MRVRHHRPRGSVITDDACYGVLGGDKKVYDNLGRGKPPPQTLLLTSTITDTTDHYGPVITVGGVGGVSGDFSHTGVRVCRQPSSERK